MELDVVQQGSELSVADCRSEAGDGGGMRIGGNFTQESGGVAAFSSCFAEHGGGCLAVEQSVYLAGFSTFKSCKASGGSTGSLGPGVLKYCRDHERRNALTMRAVGVNYIA